MSFFGLNIALRGLTAQRQALEVSAHNISNANTDGFTRQGAVLKATMDVGWGSAWKIGSGVDVEGVRRIRDALLDRQIRNQMASLGSWETRASYLQEIELVFNEPSDMGFNSQFSEFWGAWQDLSGSPDSYAARAGLVQTGSVLADLLRRDYQQMLDIRAQIDTGIESKITELNGWLEDIASLNRQIANERAVGLQPNDLLDRRDQLLDKLSKSLKVDYQESADGSVTVRLNDASGEILVQGADHSSIRQNGSMGAIQISDGVGGWADISPEDGELRAMLDIRDTVLNPSAEGSLASRLNELAKGLITLVNGIHSAGYAQDGTTTGLSFFSGSDASDIAVNSALVADPTAIAAASADGEAGNGDQALAIANALQEQLGVPASSPTATVSGWYEAFIARLGVDVQQAKAMLDNQQLLVDHLQTNRESYSGVSLDEEAVNLIRFERAYQASSRVMTSVDEMLEKLVNGVGLVGR